MKKYKTMKIKLAVIFSLIGILTAVVFVALLLGGSRLAPGGIIKGLLHPGAGNMATTILWKIRMSRIFLGLLVGMGLAVSGCILDIGHQTEMMNLMKRLNSEQGLTAITVLHDLNLAGEYCNKLLLLDASNIVCSGIPAEVLTYQNIEKTYQTVVVVKQNSISQKPHIILVSAECMHPAEIKN